MMLVEKVRKVLAASYEISDCFPCLPIWPVTMTMLKAEDEDKDHEGF